MARQLDEEKRKHILEAARHIFGEQGYRQTTIKQIAAASELAPGTLYTYFENKEMLFSAVVEDIWQRFTGSMRGISVGNSPFYEKLVEFTDLGFALIEEIHPLLRGMFSEANRRELLIERVNEVCAFIGDFFEEAHAKGLITGATRNAELRRFNLNMIVSGILFRCALSSPQRLRSELDDIRDGLILSMSDRIGLEAKG